MSKKLFITGTGTDMGKTFVAALLVKKLKECGFNSGYFKAAMSGNARAEDGTLIPGDALYVKKTAGISQPLDTMCPFVYENAYSPHLAARLEGNPVTFEAVKESFEAVCNRYEYITMEGSGGILCPVRFDNSKLMLEDVIKGLGLSCLIVADAGLGTINNVVLTVEYMRSKDINIKGIILNHFHAGNEMEEDNLKMCEQLTGLKVLACVKDGDIETDLDEKILTGLYE